MEYPKNLIRYDRNSQKKYVILEIVAITLGQLSETAYVYVRTSIIESTNQTVYEGGVSYDHQIHLEQIPLIYSNISVLRLFH